MRVSDLAEKIKLEKKPFKPQKRRPWDWDETDLKNSNQT